MFLRFFIKNGKLLIDILIIAAIIFIVVLINPGNLFGGGLKLQNTANNVTAIKEIGQLITAEYYGEAIATYDQSILKLIEEEDISDEADDIFRDMKQYLLDMHLEGLKEKVGKGEELREEKTGFFSFKWLPWVSKPKKEFRKKLDNIEVNDSLFYDNPLSPQILGFYFNKKVPKSTQKNMYKNMLWSLLQEIKAKSMELNETAFNEYMLKDLPIKDGKIFSEFHYALKRKKKEIKRELKTDLAMIGRGWVKAGIDFGELNDQNFIYDKDRQTVHIYGVYPKILAKDINPWFIPEKKIPGFQILESRNADFEHAKVVKQYCIDKLEKMAREAGILEQAERQSKETIKNFIGLLTDTEVKEVHFHNDTITRITNEIFNDKFVSFEEAKLLDSIIPKEIHTLTKINTTAENWLTNQRNRELREVRLKNIIKELKSCYYLKRPVHYNRLSYLTTRVTADSILTEAEIRQIKKQKWSIDSILNATADIELELAHTSWYADSTLAFIGEYNEMMQVIERATTTVGKKVIDTLVPLEFMVDSTSGNKYLFSRAYKKSLQYRIIVDTLNKTDILTDLKYPIYLPKKWKEKLYKKEGYFKRKQLKKDTVKIAVKELFGKISIWDTTRNSIICDSLKMVKGPNDIREFRDTSCNLENPDKKAAVHYILNYYIKESEEYNWFSKSSKKVKKAMDTEKISNKMNTFSDWFSRKTNL